MKTKLRLKKGDTVVVVAGKDKGKSGQIAKVYPNQGKVLVEGVNQVKKHVKSSQSNPGGGVDVKSVPIQYSNVMFLDPKTNKPTRIGKKWIAGTKAKKGHWVRVSKSSDTQLD